FPADHYVMVDDKLRILAAMKQVWRERLTTVFVRQGHYALDARALQAYPPADLTLAHIGELVDCSLGLVPGRFAERPTGLFWTDRKHRSSRPRTRDVALYLRSVQNSPVGRSAK